MRTKTVRSKYEKKNSITMIIRAEDQKEAEEIMKRMKMAVNKVDRQMGNTVGMEIYCSFRKSCSERKVSSI